MSIRTYRLEHHGACIESGDRDLNSHSMKRRDACENRAYMHRPICTIVVDGEILSSAVSRPELTSGRSLGSELGSLAIVSSSDLNPER